MKLIQTHIPDVVIIEPAVFEDERGWFMESFNERLFHAGLHDLGLPAPKSFVQDNHSKSKKGVLRGLHYQLPPYEQGKLVRVVKGAAFDVAVDIRKESATFGQWVGVELSEKNQRSLWIPPGFAHGFLALEEDTNFLYKTTAYYDKDSERSLRWDDSGIGIEWPVIDRLLVSEKDACAPTLKKADVFCAVDSTSSAFVEVVDLKLIGDHRGSLISLEAGVDLPFDIRRAYYIFDTKNDVSRGFHAHRKLEQMAVCVAGSCRMLVDDGSSVRNVRLDSPAKGLLMKGLVWREMHDFSPGCVLLVLASERYEESDYIRSYEQFIEEVKDVEK